MPVRFVYSAFFACLLGAAGCSKQSDEHHHGDQPTQEREASGSDAELGAAPLRLDDGKRWAANKETTDGVHNLQSLVRTASAKPTPSAPLLAHALSAP